MNVSREAGLLFSGVQASIDLLSMQISQRMSDLLPREAPTVAIRARHWFLSGWVMNSGAASGRLSIATLPSLWWPRGMSAVMVSMYSVFGRGRLAVDYAAKIVMK